MFYLSAPDLISQISTARARRDGLQSRFTRLSSTGGDKANIPVLESELKAAEARLDGLERQKSRLVVTAPISGRVVQMERNLHRDRWVTKDTLLALITSETSWIIRGYVPETDQRRLEAGAPGKFIPDDPSLSAIGVDFSKVSPTAATIIEFPELDMAKGGTVRTGLDDQNRLIPQTTQYLVTMAPSSGEKPWPRVLRGVVHLDARSESILAMVWRNVHRVLVRESVF